METLWRPDTCQCQIIVDEDGNLIPKEFNGKNYPIRCLAHQFVMGENLYSTVLLENQSKNKSLNYAIEQYPDADFTWAFDENRKIKISSDSLTSDQVLALQEYIDTNFNG